MDKMKKIFRNKKAVAIIGIVIIAVLIIGFRNSGNGKEIVKAEIGSVVQEVAVTGKLMAVGDVQLAFEQTGKVAYIPVSVGDQVVEGELLARLDQSQILVSLAKAKASLNQGEAELSELRQTSQNAYIDSRLNIIAVIKDAFTKTDDAVRNNVDQFFKNQRQSNTYVEFSFTDGGTNYKFPLDTDLKIKLTNERWAIEQALVSWEKSLNTIDVAVSLDQYIAEAERNLNLAKALMTTMADATNSLTSPSYAYDSTISGYKSTVALARTAVSTALTNFITAKDKLGQAPKQTTAGTFDKVIAKEAQVAQLRAQLDAEQVNLAKTELRSPIAGVVTKQDANVGEIMTSGTQFISIITDKDFEVEANVSEVNIGKVSIGDKVSVEFDAFPGENFIGDVTYIEPSETIVDGVVNYKVKITLDNFDERLKNGLTANIKIETARVEGVVRIPRYSITKEEGSSFVKVRLDSKTIQRVPITIGIEGSDGYVEVLDGVSNGDILVLPIAN